MVEKKKFTHATTILTNTAFKDIVKGLIDSGKYRFFMA